jgi:hypothetical protein
VTGAPELRQRVPHQLLCLFTGQLAIFDVRLHLLIVLRNRIVDCDTFLLVDLHEIHESIGYGIDA